LPAGGGIFRIRDKLRNRGQNEEYPRKIRLFSANWRLIFLLFFFTIGEKRNIPAIASPSKEWPVMRHCSVQVRGLLTKSEWDRYHALMDVGHYLESQNRYDLAYIIQKEIDILILPAIERLKEQSRERDRSTEQYLRSKAEAEKSSGES
jgi:hypothetical protein